MIAVVDFGSQYTHLIIRRLRQLGVRAEIFPPQVKLSKLKNLKGIILSGGPASVYDKKSLKTPRSNLEIDKPVLGICYGHNFIAKEVGGKVIPGAKHEYGREIVKIVNQSPLFVNLDKKQKVWLSHGDQVVSLPRGFKKTASSNSSKFAAYEKEKIYGLQFHPEVVHTENGQKILENFVIICDEERNRQLGNQIDNLIKKIKEKVGKEKVLIAVSGGVDSLVAATLIKKAVGDQIYPIFVDSGLLRKNELEDVLGLFLKLNFKNYQLVDASSLFLRKLKGLEDPEKKRKIIGKTFIEVFTNEAEKLGGKKKIKFLAQGTIYPDTIESAAASKQAEKIKTHHNLVIPKNIKFKLLEPLRDFYKDEVREIGAKLGLPRERLWKHPFPGPGLGVRVLGKVTKKKLEILREADAIYIEELNKSKVYDKIWQAFAAIFPVKSVGVMGDSRTYEYVVTLRAVTSSDGMTADWFKMPPEVLERVSSRIVNEVKGVNRVVYDVTQKPPATIEYE